MYLIVAVKVEQLICMPLFIYLVIASEVEELIGKEFHTCGIRVSLQHRPKQTPRQDINYKHSLQKALSMSHHSLQQCCCKCIISKPYCQVDMEQCDYKVAQSIHWLFGRLGSL